jgi:hypothetical protein
MGNILIFLFFFMLALIALDSLLDKFNIAVFAGCWAK